MRLFDALVHCNVPTGQINIYPVLDDHMAREAQYYLEVLHIVGRIRRPHGMQVTRIKQKTGRQSCLHSP